MLDFLEFNDVFKEEKGALNPGRIKITNAGIVFKNLKTGKLDQVPGSEISQVHWQRISSSFGLRVMLKNNNFYRFGGLLESDLEKVKKFFEHTFELDVGIKEFGLKGWNWGNAKFEGSCLAFNVDHKSTTFEIPMSNVSHCTSAKNEVTLEFHQNDEAPVSLMELRFHIPTQPDTEDAVQAFMDAVLSKADIIQATGDAIVTFSELQCLTPRGRYDIKIFPSFIQLHGKTFDYKIPLTTVLRLFRLPHKDGRQVFFVLSLDPPIKQGQTRYHFLILLFNKDDETTVELNMTEDVKDKFEKNGIEETMSGFTVEVLGKLLKLLVKRKITMPGNFMGSNLSAAITCSYKAASGFLYPLDNGFIYIHKPPIHIRFEEIISINFARSGGSTRSFDFEVETKSGVVHTFSSIEKEEYAKLYDFVTNKKLRVKNRGTESTTTDTANDDLVDSDQEDEPDAYLARVKQEGKTRQEEGDSDESDESFNPEKGSDNSDVAEEYDSNASASHSSDDDEEGGSKSKKSEKREKSKEKKEKEKKPRKEKEKKERKSKKAKDSNKPKKPMSAYFLWMNENREQLKIDNPGISITDLAKKAGETWKESVPDKTKWEQKAAQLKEQYAKDIAEYNEKGGGDEEEGESHKKSKKSRPEKESKKKAKSSPVKSSGSGFKSKEYIDESDSSSTADKEDEDGEEEEKTPKKKSKGKDKDKEKGKGKGKEKKEKEKEKDKKGKGKGKEGKSKKGKKKEESDEDVSASD